jgi:hypothetical protein
MFSYVAEEAQRRNCKFYFVSTWEMFLAIDALRRGVEPTPHAKIPASGMTKTTGALPAPLPPAND